MQLNERWHGVPLYGWYLGGSVVAGGSFILYRRWRANKAMATSGATSSTTSKGTADLSGPLPGWGGLGDALGPLGGSSPSGPLLGWTSDGQPVYGKGPDVTGAPTSTGSTDPAPAGSTTPAIAPSSNTLIGALPGEVAQPVAAVVEKILPSLQTAAPNPTPASVPAIAAPVVAGMPAGTPGISQTPAGYTVPSNWLPDIASIPKLAAAFSAVPQDIRSADWNTGKPFTTDSPVPDWQKAGFTSQQQYDNAAATAAAATASFDPANTKGTYEYYQAHPNEVYQTPFGAATYDQWKAGHDLGRW